MNNLNGSHRAGIPLQGQTHMQETNKENRDNNDYQTKRTQKKKNIKGIITPDMLKHVYACAFNLGVCVCMNA